MPNHLSQTLSLPSTWKRMPPDHTISALSTTPNTRELSRMSPSIALAGFGNSPARDTRLAAVVASSLSLLMLLPILGLLFSIFPMLSFRITTARFPRRRIALVREDIFSLVMRPYLVLAWVSALIGPSFLVPSWIMLRSMKLAVVCFSSSFPPNRYLLST